MKLHTLSFLLCVKGIVGDSIRGVEPSKQHLYQPTTIKGVRSWTCLTDPSIVLSYDQINDNYCDCPDGSDEPGTNACSYKLDQKFYCHNANHIPGYIENYKLNDGVCDYDVCCDGSDEYLTGKCPDKCSEIHDQFVKYKEDVSRDVKKSLQFKNQIVERSLRIKNDVEEKLAELRLQLKAKKEERESSSYEEVEVDEVSNSLTEISSHISHLNSKINAQQETISRLEGILNKLVNNYNPNFNDLAVKESVNSFQEYFSNKAEEKNEDNDLRNAFKLIQEAKTNETPFVEPNFGNMISFYYNRFDQKESVKASTVKTSKPLSNADVEALDKEIKALEFDIQFLENDLLADFGPDDILRSLQTVSVTNRIGEYTYRIGLLSNIYQDNVLIGKYSHFEDNKLHFRNGDKCWNGPYRSGVIGLVCGSSHKLISVSEPEKCEYSFELISPIVCKEYSDEDLLANFEINYEELK